MKRLQKYAAAGITVTFEPEICIHSAVCLRTLPAVFDVRRRRWVAPEAAPTAEITAAIGLCPSGALKYVLDGQADAPAAEAGGQPTTSIVASRGGPLLVQGLFTLLDEEGKEIPVAERAALCRCGGTANAPFCDGTHRAIGFTPRRKADS